ncbi:MAG: DUF1801 domain-containing protein [Gallionella sp.]
MNPKVEEFLKKSKKWPEEMAKLRKIALDCQLTEELKWNQPCYTYQGSNIVIIGAFKDYCVLMFFKGALLQDAGGILIKPGENTQSARQIRFTDVREIIKMTSVLKAYIREAIAAEKAGLKVNFKKTAEYAVPEEFRKKLDKSRALKDSMVYVKPFVRRPGSNSVL